MYTGKWQVELKGKNLARWQRAFSAVFSGVGIIAQVIGITELDQFVIYLKNPAGCYEEHALQQVQSGDCCYYPGKK